MKLVYLVSACVLALAFLAPRTAGQQALVNFAMGMLQSYFSQQLSIAGLLLQLVTRGATAAFGLVGKRDVSGIAHRPVEEELSYFNAIRTLDNDDCIAELLCVIAKAPRRFGRFSKDVYTFFRRHQVPHSASPDHYRHAFESGLSGRDCKASFPNCKVDVTLLGRMLQKL